MIFLKLYSRDSYASNQGSDALKEQDDEEETEKS